MEKASTATQLAAVSSNREGVDIIRALPGESLLVDLEYKSPVAHGKHGVILLPAPSSDPNDPLNWSMGRKYLDIGLVCFWAFMLGSVTLSPNVAYGSLIMQWGVDATFLNIGTAVMLFNLGFFNIIFSPVVCQTLLIALSLLRRVSPRSTGDVASICSALLSASYPRSFPAQPRTNLLGWLVELYWALVLRPSNNFLL